MCMHHSHPLLLQVKHLAPLHVREVEKAVAILTAEEGIGTHHIREDVISPVSGYSQPLILVIVKAGALHPYRIILGHTQL